MILGYHWSEQITRFLATNNSIKITIKEATTSGSLKSGMCHAYKSLLQNNNQKLNRWKKLENRVKLDKSI